MILKIYRVVDFQLKFLHEEAKNFQDGNEDIQSKLVAQKREIETEYREMRKRCDPEIENDFSSDFVHYLTKLTATFSKAHILTTVSAIEGTERELRLGFIFNLYLVLFLSLFFFSIYVILFYFEFQ